MKVRFDFVTNSSSSGFVCIVVETKDGSFRLEDEYDSGYGGWIWNYNDTDELKESLGKVKSGPGLYVLLTKNVENLNGFPDAGKFKMFLWKITHADDLQYIKMEETTKSDGDTYDFILEYDFEANKVISYHSGWKGI